MSYPGDSSLSQEIRERIVNTFDQTLDLAEAGNTAEALLGCDFMLRLDPLFEPARTLQDRIQNADPPFDVADLRGTIEWISEGDAAADLDEEKEADDDVIRFDDPRSLSDALELDVEEPPDDDTEEPSGEDTPESPDGSSKEDRKEKETLVSPADVQEDQRVQSLLDEGQHALARKRFQKAIDVWSRIFLIDTDNQEATRRIEEARLLNDERERKIEERFNEAVSIFEGGDESNAFAAFEQVLFVEPEHLEAQQYIERIRARRHSSEPKEEKRKGKAAADGEGDLAPSTLAPPAPPTFSGEGGTGGDPITFDSAKAEPTDSNQRLLLIGSAVLLLVVAGGVLLYQNWSRLFPNSDETVTTADTSRMPDRIARITDLYLRGDMEQARAALEKIQPDSGDYERAQLLLSDWAAALPDKGTDEARQAAEAERRRLLQLAREAYSAREYLSAARMFTRASSSAPLEGAEADLFEDAKRQLEPIAQMIDLYTQREYKLALPGLWRYFFENPDNRDVRRLLVNSNYNLAIRSLRRGHPKEAEALLAEALDLDTDDAMAQRLLLFTETYIEAPRDLLYDIMIEILESRP